MINNIRFTSNQMYGIKPELQEAKNTQKEENEQVFEISQKPVLNQQPEENKVNFYALGAPAGFFMDMSLLEEMEANEGLLKN